MTRNVRAAFMSTLILSAALLAQTAPPAPVATTAPSVSLPAWVGIGAQYVSAASPHYNPWIAAAFPVNSTVDSFSLYLPTVSNGKLVLSTTTGFATKLTKISTRFGPVTFEGLGTVGVSSGFSTGFAYNLGGGAWLNPRNSPFTIEIVLLEAAAGSTTKPTVLAGVGYSWNWKKP